MPRTSSSCNKTFYHYKVNQMDKNDNIISTNYFMSIYDICEKFNTGYRNVSHAVNKGRVQRGLFKEYQILKVQEPVYKLVMRTKEEILEGESDAMLEQDIGTV